MTIKPKLTINMEVHIIEYGWGIQDTSAVCDTLDLDCHWRWLFIVHLMMHDAYTNNAPWSLRRFYMEAKPHFVFLQPSWIGVVQKLCTWKLSTVVFAHQTSNSWWWACICGYSQLLGVTRVLLLLSLAVIACHRTTGRQLVPQTTGFNTLTELRYLFKWSGVVWNRRTNLAIEAVEWISYYTTILKIRQHKAFPMQDYTSKCTPERNETAS
jgi:hypothetical protein